MSFYRGVFWGSYLVKSAPVDSRTKCNREEERGEKFERGDVVMFLSGSVVE